MSYLNNKNIREADRENLFCHPQHQSGSGIFKGIEECVQPIGNTYSRYRDISIDYRCDAIFIVKYKKSYCHLSND
ncbi:unnamed protein product [Nezara viridula]|uniref:Uncharacterized protein n=1 Tax=Nezara viridula TaxID=85310 RepID=A0A9P0HSB8_NEZVI|nr:unnamed protein product [Nezara viridula]